MNVLFNGKYLPIISEIGFLKIDLKTVRTERYKWAKETHNGNVKIKDIKIGFESLINEYLNGDKIYHFDFYRIKNKNELLDIGIDEYISSNNRCFIEWPNLITDMLPDKHIELNIDVISSDVRKLTINY